MRREPFEAIDPKVGWGGGVGRGWVGGIFKIQSESSQAQNLKGDIANASSKANDPSCNIPNDESQANDPKRKFQGEREGCRANGRDYGGR